MSGWNSWGIRRKLFSVVVLILALNVVVLLVMGSTLFESFYLSSKMSELCDGAEAVRAAYEAGSVDFYDKVGSIENENTQVSIFSMNMKEDGSLELIYHSRANRSKDWNRPKDLPPPSPDNDWLSRMQKQMAERFRETDETLNVRQSGDGDKSRDITLSTRLDDGLYLYMQTPRDYIRSTADLAVKYTALLSIGILLIGSVVIYFVVARVTKPIQQIQKVAGQIAKMDFSEKCEVRGGDEIAKLGGSINHMSAELQGSIERLVQANEVLQNDLVRQQQTDRMRRQFVANVSHDFKTPLTLMVSYAEAIAEEADGQVREWCETIIGEGNKLSRMVGRLLNLSKLENGIDQVEISIFCLGEVFEEVVKNLRLLTERRRLTVRREFEEDFIVSADFQKVEQVATNLFENAVKYTPEGGSITIRARRLHGKCHVEVTNTGEHIAEEDLGNLFDSFYRADKSRSRALQSYGLGLAIVKVVMEAHGQAFGVENVEGGVRFWFELEPADFEEENDGDPGIS